VLSLLGDVVIDEGALSVNAHVVLGRSDGTSMGGRLGSATTPRPG
jgi:predicted DNA-binding protein with PD1-like motif